MTAAPPPVAGTGLPLESAPAMVPPAIVAVERTSPPVQPNSPRVEPSALEPSAIEATALEPSAIGLGAVQSSAAPVEASAADVARPADHAPTASLSRSADPVETGGALPQRTPTQRPGTSNGTEHPDGEGVERGATGPQLRRFIKSRAYVPMHELRRRFLINGGDDEVTPVDLGEHHRVFVGLPEREGRLLGELLRGGDIGYELSLDPISPIVVGVYPMRPVTRA